MTPKQEEARRLREGDRLYKRYGEPLEGEHWGEYVMIYPDGKTVLGDSDLEVVQKALDEYGKGGFLFKIGPKVVYTIR